MYKSKKRVMKTGLLAAALACGAGVTEAAHAASNVAGWVKTADKVGTAPSDETVTIAMHLALKNADALQTFAKAVSSPSNKEYGHYLTPDEFATRFAPASADVDAVKAMLVKAGMKNVTAGPHGVYVSATASIAQLRTTFHVSQDLYSYKGLTLRANKEEPTLPAALTGKVAFVQGLDDTMSLRHPFHRSATAGTSVAPAAAGRPTQALTASEGSDLASTDSTASTSAVTPPPVAANLPSPYCNTYFGSKALIATLSTPADVYGATIPWLNCGYTPQQIQAAYGLDKVKKYDGTGVTVAIVDAYASPTLLADANRYAAKHKLPALKKGANFSQIIPIGIYDVSPDETCGPYGWWTEESLDMAAVHGSAPGATILYVGARDCGTSLTIALYNVLYEHLADVATNSYGYNGEAIAPGQQAMDDQAAMAGAAQGITILFSSGDDGDLSQLNGVASGAWEATSAWVTGVGGTSLLLNDSTGSKSEYGWGTYRAYLADATVNSAKSVTTSGVETTTAFGVTFDAFAFYSGSGGGISLLEAQPAYQAKAVPEVLATSLDLSSGEVVPLPAAQRVSPDVAMDADPYTGYLYGETFTIAGDPIDDAGCTPISSTAEYCEVAEGGTSLASPLMAGVIAVMDQKRAATGEATVGFANPLLYSAGSRSDGVHFNQALNQIIAPTEPVSVLRGYANDLTRIRVVTINSVPLLIDSTPFPIEVCGLPICLGINDVFNYTSLSSASLPPTPAGYNDVTGLGVPYLPKLINEE